MYKLFMPCMPKSRQDRYRLKVIEQSIVNLTKAEKEIMQRINNLDNVVNNLRIGIINQKKQSIPNQKEILFYAKRIKMYMLSRDKNYTMLLNISMMKLKIDEAKMFTSVNETLKLCADNLRHIVSEDKLSEYEKAIEQLEDANDNISDIESRLNQLGNMLSIKDEVYSKDNDALYNDESILKELDSLLTDDIPTSTKKIDPPKKPIIQQKTIPYQYMENGKLEEIDDKARHRSNNEQTKSLLAAYQ